MPSSTTSEWTPRRTNINSFPLETMPEMQVSVIISGRGGIAIRRVCWLVRVTVCSFFKMHLLRQFMWELDEILKQYFSIWYVL